MKKYENKNDNEEEEIMDDEEEDGENNVDNNDIKSEHNKEEEKENEFSNVILNLSLFEDFYDKAKKMRGKKEEVIQKELLSLKLYEEIDEKLKKTLLHYSNEFNKILDDDLNFIILSKIIFITFKQNNNNFQEEFLSNLNRILNIITQKFTEEAFNKFNDYMNLKKDEFSLCLKKLTEKEVKKLQTNLDFLLKPAHKTLSDSDKTKTFVSKNVESSKIMQKHIIIEKLKDPSKFINIDDTLKDPKNISKILNSKEDSHLVLSLCGKLLQNNDVNISVCKKKDEKFLNIELASLNSLITLGKIKKYEIFYDYTEEQINEILNDVVVRESFKNKIKTKIASKFKLNKNEIIINEIEPYEDYDNQKKVLKITLTVPNHYKDFSKELNEFLEEEENIQKRLNIKKRLIEALAFSPALLDQRGDKHKNWCTNNIRGGELYEPPGEGWIGLGINVLDKYENNDWLRCDNKEGEFAIGYIGLNNLLNYEDDISKQTSNLRRHKLYQFDTNIKVKGGWCEKCGPRCGEGITVFQNPKYAENSAGIVDVSGYRAKIILMCRVNPLKIRRPKNANLLWILNPTSDEIRPYRILIKVLPCSPLANTKSNETINEIITTDTPVDFIIDTIKSNDLTFVQTFKEKDELEDIYTLNGQKLNDDFFAIRLYSSEYYKYINEYLRTQNVPQNELFSEDEIKSWICCLHLALSRNKNVDDDTIVYRGVGNRKFSENIGVGSKFYFREFTSTSIEKSEAEKFKEDGGTLMIIRIKNNGTNGYPNYCFYVDDISCFPGEKEVLISAHCYYSVTNIRSDGEVNYVYLTCEGFILNGNNNTKYSYK